MNHRWSLRELKRTPDEDIVHFSVECSVCGRVVNIGHLLDDSSDALGVRHTKMYYLVGRKQPRCSSVLLKNVLEE